jgi:hypothetical protein
MSNSKYKNKIKVDVLNFMVENYDRSIEIKEFCDKVLIDTQNEFIKNPPIYMTLLKDTRSDIEIKYSLTAKTFFPISINKTKEIRIYVGRLDEYPNGTKDVRGKVLGRKLMIERLKRELNNN